MTPATFEETINLQAFTDFDACYRLRPQALMQFMQDVATHHADIHHVGRDFNTAPRLGWVIVKFHGEFTTYPTKLEQLTLATEFRGYHGMWVRRDFTLSSHGPILGRATSLWTLLNLEERKIVSPAQTLPYPWMNKISARPDDLDFCPPVAFTAPDLTSVIMVSFDDLDLHQHANNSLYLTWALRPLSEDFRRQYALKMIDIIFKKEITANTQIIAEIKFLHPQQTMHRLVNEQGTVFALVQCHWQ